MTETPPSPAQLPSPAPLLTRDAIRTVNDLVTEDVQCPEWGGTVRIRGLTGRERDEFEASMVAHRDGGRRIEMRVANVRARLVAMAAVDADGHQLFAADDVGWLGKKSAAALDRCWEVARRLARLTDADVEELVGNFDDDPSGSSPSD